MPYPKISVVLNAYKRLHYLDEQIRAICKQSVPPVEILIWNNSGTILPIDINSYEIPITVCSSSRNTGVWSRFFLSYNCIGEYVAVFDDDTIPGRLWFLNCLKCMDEKIGLYGTIGCRFGNTSYFKGMTREGWDSQNNNIEEVDIIGHAWFFKKEWLKYFSNDIPDLERFKIVGEDFHLSYSFRKYGGIRSYVPPHPSHNKDLHGSIKPLEYGEDDVATYKQSGTNDKFEDAYNYWIKFLGHKLIKYPEL